MFLVVNRNTARALFLQGEEVYKLYDDGSEGLIESPKELHRHKGQFGIGVGFIKDLVNEFLRNNNIKTIG